MKHTTQFSKNGPNYANGRTNSTAVEFQTFPLQEFLYSLWFSSLAARRRTTKLLTFDDHDEKENSLNESGLDRRRQSRLFNNSINVENIQDEPVQTPTQLVDLYQKTLELAAQGKINIKNAFSFPLVERLPQVLNAIALDDIENHHLGPNFVKAGSVIDTRFANFHLLSISSTVSVPKSTVFVLMPYTRKHKN